MFRAIRRLWLWPPAPALPCCAASAPPALRSYWFPSSLRRSVAWNAQASWILSLVPHHSYRRCPATIKIPRWRQLESRG